MVRTDGRQAIGRVAAHAVQKAVDLALEGFRFTKETGEQGADPVDRSTCRAASSPRVATMAVLRRASETLAVIGATRTAFSTTVEQVSLC
ncbi:hypothetical protein [Azospirillum brasilense]|uniref:Uncharacterized protein n=1 Tax=Azospirillum brasilense TaxID=192 RepID=A0A235HDI2_AZOBR|nr:hypothetical protein [Azospirillum brasilense]OYD83871.1 hypothetical protein CHT98_13905 [Azospirillum brasilense]